ncbi:MAG: hypothetical protein KJO52_09465 [Maribacter sp.]|nr:hypothetical protein [Maribacter sp.]MBT8301530.1 hypothetical protein [Maribacter sp.]NND79204.1 hypothetical protein [Maribacter sp.]
MNKLLIIFVSVLSFLTNTNENDCSVVYNRATYALSHSKKALKSNNFDHQLYYSGKTLESYKKIADGMKYCDCTDAIEFIEDITNDAEKAADPVDWDRGRYYSKKVYLNTQELITMLDLWTSTRVQQDEALGTQNQ